MKKKQDISTLTEYQRDEFEERAAIMQFDGGLTKERAEQEALKRVLCKGTWK